MIVGGVLATKSCSINVRFQMTRPLFGDSTPRFSTALGGATRRVRERTPEFRDEPDEEVATALRGALAIESAKSWGLERMPAKKPVKRKLLR